MTTAPQRRVRFRVVGRVQGVAFRYSARHEAMRLGLAGWVRNLSDGAVEGLVAGGASEVGLFLSWCAHGPAGARVDDLSLVEDEGTDALPAFEIRR